MFSFVSPQAIHFGRGQSKKTTEWAATFGSSVLVVHGANVARAQWLIDGCHAAGLTVATVGCANEPRLPEVEGALRQLKGVTPDVVIGIGGGSVLDFAKALAALIPCEGDPMAYLEVVGDGRPLDRDPLPMIALPTTAGTGAEVTKNAVILVPDHCIKVSLRDPRMVPNIAIVDPALMQGAPRQVALTAALDAVTQVIEPYLSIKANPMTDALSRAAISTGLNALKDLVEHDSPEAWDSMAWVSTCGGLALANAGLGAVHGFAGVIGGETNAPHGAICGALLPAVLESHLSKVEKHTQTYVRLNWILDQIDTCFANGQSGVGIAELRRWSRAMGFSGLEGLGLSVADYPRIAKAASKASSMRGNPFVLSQNELLEILYAAR